MIIRINNQDTEIHKGLLNASAYALIQCTGMILNRVLMSCHRHTGQVSESRFRQKKGAYVPGKSILIPKQKTLIRNLVKCVVGSQKW